VGGARDLPERQQTMRAAISWSYDLLHPGEKALLRRLAVFAGGCTVEAVEGVCPAGMGLEADVLGWLGELVDKSLMQRQTAGGEPRVGMLETVREFALEQLAAAGALLNYSEAVITGGRGPSGLRGRTWQQIAERELLTLAPALRL
jgi:predicted ATPase